MTTEVFEGPQLPPDNIEEVTSKSPPSSSASTSPPSTLSQLRCRVDCGQSAVRAVRFSADGEFALTAGSDRTVCLWSPHRASSSPSHSTAATTTTTTKPLSTYRQHSDEVLSVDGACDNSRVVSAGIDRAVIVSDVCTGRVLNRWRRHHGTVNAVRFNEDASVVVSGARDGSVRVWDCRSGGASAASGGAGSSGGSSGPKPIQVLHEARDSVQCVCVSDYEIVSGSADGCVRHYDLRRALLTTDTISKQPVSWVSLSADGQCLLVSSTDATLRLIDKTTGQLLKTYSGHKNSRYPLQCCLDCDDAVVLSGSEDGCVYGWNLVSGKECVRLEHPISAMGASTTVHSLSFHPTRPSFLTACGGAFYLWGCEVAH